MMPQNQTHHQLGQPFCLPPQWRWIFWPIIATGGGGIALTLCTQEDTITLIDCASIAAIPGLAALLYFNHCLFNKAIPRPDDLGKPFLRHNLLNKKD
ncbi:MAG: hypothetical protein C0401_11485 [Anaerolinea sp.]|nr:hypothetical protein [Anaerolinea sp.]